MSDASSILDARGQPMRRPSKKALTEQIATASLTGVRQAWSAMTITSGLTPERLARIMRLAAEGDHTEFVILAEEMEERDWHYAAALAQRKLAVLGLPRNVETPDDPRGQAIADAVRRDIVEDEAFEDLLAGCLDAMGKGWAAIEIGYDTQSSPWKPSSYDWKDPRWFRWDRETGRELRLIDEADLVNGIALPDFRYAVHRPQLKMGLPVRGGLARLAAWAFMFKFYSVKDWAAFAETYGQPLRVGKYDAAATQKDIDVLYQAVAMIGTDCAAVIPKAMEIEFVNAMAGASGSGADLYEKFCEWLDRQVSKAVLGQTGTTDMQKGGGYAQAKVLDGVRGDLTESDAQQLARTIRRDVFQPYVLFNFGPEAPVPGFSIAKTPAEDLEKFTASITPLIDRGLKVKTSEVSDRFGLQTPQASDEVLQGQTSPAPGLALPTPDTKALNRAKACPSCGTAHNKPLVSAGGVADTDAVDDLADPLNEGWEPVMDAALEPILHLAARAGSFEEFSAELDAASGAMNMSPLAKALALQLFKAKGLGDATDSVAS